MKLWRAEGSCRLSECDRTKQMHLFTQERFLQFFPHMLSSSLA